jgi:hypothetical protein
MLVDINREFEHGIDRAGRVRLDIDRIHVFVFMEREGKTPDVLGAVFEGEIVAERFFLEDEVHGDTFSAGMDQRSRTRLLPLMRETQIMIFWLPSRSSGAR